jgi:hypothetical protein
VTLAVARRWDVLRRLQWAECTRHPQHLPRLPAAASASAVAAAAAYSPAASVSSHGGWETLVAGDGPVGWGAPPVGSKDPFQMALLNSLSNCKDRIGWETLVAGDGPVGWGAPPVGSKDPFQMALLNSLSNCKDRIETPVECKGPC